MHEVMERTAVDTTFPGNGPVADPFTANPQRGSVAYVRVGGREYPIAVAPKCKVCGSARRREIEELMLAGQSGRHVIRTLGLEDADLSTRNLTDHFRAHVPLAAATVDAIRDQLATE